MKQILSGALTIIIYIFSLGWGGGGLFRHSIKLENVGLPVTVFKFQSKSIHGIEIVSMSKHSVK